MLHRLIVLFLFILCQQVVFASSQITKVRAWKSPDKTRVVFEISDKFTYKAFQLSKPERLVVDIKNTAIDKNTLRALNNSALIVASRSSKKSNNSLRVVLELKKKVQFKAFQLLPGKGYRHRLVVDLFEKSQSLEVSITKKLKKKQSTTVLKNSVSKQKSKVKSLSKSKITKSATNIRTRDLIVAIDAGHGGEDPGAIGRKGTKEKKIVLAIAKKLARRVNKQAGMKAVMIRGGDYYISLRGRTRKARKVNADVFISIHADAFRNSKARGSSVFILSKRGASSETARWLADKENSADLAGGVSLDDKDDLLAKVLLDLSQTASIEGSNSVARRVLKGLKRIGKTHKKKVERAGFVVLKSPDIPSILVETGFISNPYEEKQLRRASYQKKIADAIFVGINDYFKRYPIPGTVYGQALTRNVVSRQTSIKKITKHKTTRSGIMRHKVVRGDSLSMLAKRYGVSIKEIKRSNRIYSNTLVLGKVLSIPR
ncbi:MAG: N-acetylmuramoyl-L-alanine amidase [Pseudomonadota bacterium]